MSLSIETTTVYLSGHSSFFLFFLAYELVLLKSAHACSFLEFHCNWGVIGLELSYIVQIELAG